MSCLKNCLCSEKTLEDIIDQAAVLVRNEAQKHGITISVETAVAMRDKLIKVAKKQGLIVEEIQL